MNANEKLVAHYLISQKAFPGSFGFQRSHFVKALNMKRSTVYDALKRLEARGIVQRFPKPNGKGIGRHSVFWTLTEEEF